LEDGSSAANNSTKKKDTTEDELESIPNVELANIGVVLEFTDRVIPPPHLTMNDTKDDANRSVESGHGRLDISLDLESMTGPSAAGNSADKNDEEDKKKKKGKRKKEQKSPVKDLEGDVTAQVDRTSKLVGAPFSVLDDTGHVHGVFQLLASELEKGPKNMQANRLVCLGDLPTGLFIIDQPHEKPLSDYDFQGDDSPWRFAVGSGRFEKISIGKDGYIYIFHIEHKENSEVKATVFLFKYGKENKNNNSFLVVNVEGHAKNITDWTKRHSTGTGTDEKRFHRDLLEMRHTSDPIEDVITKLTERNENDRRKNVVNGRILYYFVCKHLLALVIEEVRSVEPQKKKKKKKKMRKLEYSTEELTHRMKLLGQASARRLSLYLEEYEA